LMRSFFGRGHAWPDLTSASHPVRVSSRDKHDREWLESSCRASEIQVSKPAHALHLRTHSCRCRTVEHIPFQSEAESCVEVRRMDKTVRLSQAHRDCHRDGGTHRRSICPTHSSRVVLSRRYLVS